MAFQSIIFWGCLGGIFCWILFWSVASPIIKKHQPFSNPWVNKFAENVEIVVILPLIPPILLYALVLRFTYYPCKRFVQRRVQHRREIKQEVELRTEFGERRLTWAQEDLQHVRREKMPLVEEVEVIASDGGESLPPLPRCRVKSINMLLTIQLFKLSNRLYIRSNKLDFRSPICLRSFVYRSTVFWTTELHSGYPE